MNTGLRKRLKLDSPNDDLFRSRRGSGGGGGDFVAGFLLGGALFGAAAYIFAPQVMIPFNGGKTTCGVFY